VTLEDIGKDSGPHRSQTSEEIAAADVFAIRSLVPHLLLSLLFLVPLIGCLAVWAAAFSVGQINTVMANGGIAPELANAFAAAAGSILFAWMVTSFRPLREPLADRAIILEGHAGAIEQVYGAIYDNAARFCAPPFRLTPQKLEGMSALSLRLGNEHGLVTVRPIGSDLFVGWSVWRRRSSARLIGQVINNVLDSAHLNAYSAAAASSFVIMREQLECMTLEASRSVAPGNQRTDSPHVPQQRVGIGPGVLSGSDG